MTLTTFMERLESAYGAKGYTEGQKSAIAEKCLRFNERELNRIYSDLLENCRYLPKIADIYESARSMGLLQAPSERQHRWTPTDCPLCDGEGRLGVFWEFYREVRGEDSVEVNRLVKILPYTKSFEYSRQSDQFRSIWRCRCSAGDVPTIPKAWPKWSNSVEPVRTVYS